MHGCRSQGGVDVLDARGQLAIYATVGVYFGLWATKHVAAGIEGFESYAISVQKNGKSIDDDSRAAVVVSPNVRLVLPFVEPAISAFTNIGTPLQGASDRIWGFKFAFTVVYDPSRALGVRTTRAERLSMPLARAVVKDVAIEHGACIRPVQLRRTDIEHAPAVSDSDPPPAFSHRVAPDAMLQAEAGNLALKCVSVGGVFVGGGIAPKILPALRKGGFLQAFVDKGRFRHLLEGLEVNVALNPRAPLLGAAHYAARMA